MGDEDNQKFMLIDKPGMNVGVRKSMKDSKGPTLVFLPESASLFSRLGRSAASVGVTQNFAEA
jgi:hypothetical protein